VHFQKANRGEGDDGHVERVEPRIGRQEAIAEHAGHDHQHDEQDDDPQPGKRPHVMALLIAVAGISWGVGIAPSSLLPLTRLIGPVFVSALYHSPGRRMGEAVKRPIGIPSTR
jgi:hypothetical protein